MSCASSFRLGGLHPVLIGDTRLVMTRGDRGGRSKIQSPEGVVTLTVYVLPLKDGEKVLD